MKPKFEKKGVSLSLPLKALQKMQPWEELNLTEKRKEMSINN